MTREKQFPLLCELAGEDIIYNLDWAHTLEGKMLTKLGTAQMPHAFQKYYKILEDVCREHAQFTVAMMDALPQHTWAGMVATAPVGARMEAILRYHELWK